MSHDRCSHRSLLLVTASVQAALLLVSAAVATRALAQAGPDVLRIAQIEQVTNFDPALMSTQDMRVLIGNVYEGLIGTERDTVRIVPRLAEKWALSPDGKSMTFVLRKNVKFHGGTPFDAEAVKFSIERVKAINKGPAVFIKGISGVDIVDKSTIRLRIAENPRLAYKALALVMMVSPALKSHEEGGDSGRVVHPKGRYVLQPGDAIATTEPGGGLGDPRERAAERVLEDVRAGLVTVDGALRDYGAVVDLVAGRAWRPGTTNRQRSAHG